MFFPINLNVACVLALLGLASTEAKAQQCDPCVHHCALLGAAANAECVKSGRDPVVCGRTPRVANPQSNVTAAIVNEPNILAAGPPCTSQGICFREGIAAKGRCMASCFICTPSSVHPDFLLISILYAPPGNASTASFGQSQSSGVIYGISSNFTETEGTSTTVSFGVQVDGVDGGFSIGFQSGSSSGGGSSDQFSVVTTATNGYSLKPGKDPVDHTQDVFLLWLNPVVTLTKSDQKTLAAAITAGEVTMAIQTVTAGQLMNGIPPEKLAPSTICPTATTCYTLPGLGSLTKADIAAILAQDPFLTLKPGETPDASRFVYIRSEPLESTAVAGNTGHTFTISDAQTTTSTNSTSGGSSEGVTSGISAKAMGLGITLTNSESWAWTTSVSHGASSGQTQQASITLSSTTLNCCGINNSVTCEVSIWEDMVYRTFVFLPQPETCQASLLGTPPLVAATKQPAAQPLAPTAGGPPLQGTVTQGGTAISGAIVVISDAAGKVLYQVKTDHQGRYFSGAIASGPVSVQVGGQTLTTTIKAAQPTVLNLAL